MVATTASLVLVAFPLSLPVLCQSNARKHGGDAGEGPGPVLVAANRRFLGTVVNRASTGGGNQLTRVIVPDAPNMISIYVGGRRLDRLEAKAAQYFRWRFLTLRVGDKRTGSRRQRRGYEQWLRLTVRAVAATPRTCSTCSGPGVREDPSRYSTIVPAGVRH